MTTSKIKNLANKLTQNTHSTFESALKELASVHDLQLCSSFNSDDFDVEGDSISKIYELNDGFLIITETEEMDFADFTHFYEDAEAIAETKIRDLAPDEEIYFED